jgi:hypothetical protein
MFDSVPLLRLPIISSRAGTVNLNHLLYSFGFMLVVVIDYWQYHLQSRRADVYGYGMSTVTFVENHSKSFSIERNGFKAVR